MISLAHKDKFFFDFDEALRIVGYAYDNPCTKLRQLDKGEIKEIKLTAGTLVKFVMPGKGDAKDKLHLDFDK